MIRSRATRQFRRLLSGLPDEVQQDARRAYALFRTNPGHPSLHFKKIEGFNDVE
ncbi:MAG: hypothetical protein IPM24_16515 [Bryobacterales bacterium]|nr:hypothetical protein [Bryobacterales bacterium]